MYNGIFIENNFSSLETVKCLLKKLKNKYIDMDKLLSSYLKTELLLPPTYYLSTSTSGML